MKVAWYLIQITLLIGLAAWCAGAPLDPGNVAYAADTAMAWHMEREALAYPPPTGAERCLLEVQSTSVTEDAGTVVRVGNLLLSCMELFPVGSGPESVRVGRLFKCATDIGSPVQIAEFDSVTGWQEAVADCTGGSQAWADRPDQRED